MKRSSFLLVLFLIVLLNSNCFSESQNNNLAKWQFGISNGFNLGLLMGSDLYFPYYEHTKFENDFEILNINGAFLLRNINRQNYVKLAYHYYEFKAYSTLYPISPPEVSLNIRINRFSLELIHSLLCIKILNTNILAGISLNHINYYFIKKDICEREIILKQQPESGNYFGFTYGIDFLFFPKKPINFSINITNRQIYIKNEWRNFNLFLEISISTKYI